MSISKYCFRWNNSSRMQIIIKYYHCRLAKEHHCNFSAFGVTWCNYSWLHFTVSVYFKYIHSVSLITQLNIHKNSLPSWYIIYVGTLLKTMKYQSSYLPNIIYYKHIILKSYRLLIVTVLKCLLYIHSILVFSFYYCKCLLLFKGT